MTHLTRDQLAAIHAAQKAGLTKRELFEFNVSLQKQSKRSAFDRERDLQRLAQLQKIERRQIQNEAEMAHLMGKPFDRPRLHGAERTFIEEKAIASLGLIKSQKAKEAFLRKRQGLSKQDLESLK